MSLGVIGAVAVAAVLAFLASMAYYVAFARASGPRSTAASPTGRPTPWKAGLELGRNVVLSAGVAFLVRTGHVAGAGPSVLLALVLWLALPVVLLSGSAIWERVPLRLAALHAGDWLVKLVLVTLVVATLS
jgi:hypothetical protein